MFATVCFEAAARPILDTHNSMRLVNRPFEIIWLQDFLALSDSGSFSRAAEERHVAQPAFSRRIRSLEEWLGATLIDRSTHPASLTEAGIRFRPLAADILHRVASAREETRTAQATAAATLRFAATHALSLTFFPTWIRSLEARMHGAPIHLISDSLQACEELMLHGRAQLLLCHYHPNVENRLDSGGSAARTGFAGIRASAATQRQASCSRVQRCIRSRPDPADASGDDAGRCTGRVRVHRPPGRGAEIDG